MFNECDINDNIKYDIYIYIYIYIVHSVQVHGLPSCYLRPPFLGTPLVPSGLHTMCQYKKH